MKSEYTFNSAKLRGRIIEMFNSIQEFAEETSRTYQYVVNVLNNKASLTHKDMDEWINILKIENADIYDYFFRH